jgi:hypothetical protein
MGFIKKKILVVVKTYPNPSKQNQETVCVAGVLLENPPSWIRIYPVPFRDLPYDQQFKKYHIIEAGIKKNTADFRPESYKVNFDSLKIIEEIGRERNWERRKQFLLPLVDFSMCKIQKEREDTHKSLGIFKPAMVEDFIIEPGEKEWSKADRNLLSQSKLFGNDNNILEKIPYKFKIKYKCFDLNCNGHNQGIIDWETAQLYRNLKVKYHQPTLIEKLKSKYLDDVFNSNKDFHFVVGNSLKGPKAFSIISVFYPPKDDQLPLFYL